MEETNKKIIIAKLARECATNADNKELLKKLKEQLSSFPKKEQYEMVLRLQDPTNVNGSQPSIEYFPVRDCFMQNLVVHYSVNVTHPADFAKHISSFSDDQLASLKSALESAQQEGIPANTQLNQNGQNVTVSRFNEYIKMINTLYKEKVSLGEREI